MRQKADPAWTSGLAPPKAGCAPVASVRCEDSLGVVRQNVPRLFLRKRGLSSGDERIAGQEVAKRLVGGFADANPRSDLDFMAGKSVVADPKSRRRGSQIGTVVANSSDAEGLSETSGAAGELPERVRTGEEDIAGAGHLFYSEKRLKCTEEYRSSFALALTRNIQTVVIAVDEIDVGVAGRTEEDSGASSIAG